MKSNNETMKKDEMTVLDILEQHANENINEIAKRSGFSRQKVQRIIKHLEEKKIIWGYSAISLIEEKGKHFILLLMRSMMPLNESMKKEVITEKLDNHLPSGVTIENIFIVHGESWNAMVSFYAPDLVTAKKVVEGLFQRTGKYFTNQHLLIQVLFPIRKNGFKNPRIKELVDYI